MDETQSLFAALRQSSDDKVVDAIEQLVREGEDRHLARVNALAFAKDHGFDESAVIGAFLFAARLGMFELSWNVLCPGCGGVLETNATLKSIQKAEYSCSLCAEGYEPTLDEMIEVTFTVTPRIRRIAAHNPQDLPPAEYFRQIYFGSGLEIPDDFESVFETMTIESLDLPAGDKAIVSLQLPAAFLIVCDPVTHTVQFLDVKGEPVRERQSLSIIFDRDLPSYPTVEMRPGPLRIAMENRTDSRVLPTIFVADDALHEFMKKRRPFLTAKQLLSNQTFRDIYRTDTLDVDQRLKITSLTFLFTDLRGSTELYERVGDLVAFDLVRTHFDVLNAIVASEAGAVVKTIGDAVMATFPTPDRAVAAAIRMREAMRDLNREREREDLLLKIGIHEGPCIAVTMNERQDYFGQTVNIASRVQGLATSSEIYVTGVVVEDPRTSGVLEKSGIVPRNQKLPLRGIATEVSVYALP
jgi:class 3 adenylate cyclase